MSARKPCGRLLTVRGPSSSRWSLPLSATTPGTCGEQAATLWEHARRRKESLLQALVDPHPMVRAAALGALESLLDERLVEELAAELSRPDKRLRRALVEALADSGDSAEGALLSLVSDPVSDVRLAVARALARSQRPDARQALARLADDPDPAVRHAVSMLAGAAADGP